MNTVELVSYHQDSATEKIKSGDIILIGNPNVGKSVIFGELTKHYVTVSNYPGTTIEITAGTLPDGTPIIDTPGTNSLTSISDDERVTANVLFEHLNDLQTVVQIADMKNLQRALLLTLQLAELNVPMILNLNMMDEAHANGVSIDTDLLSQRLGIPVCGTIASQGVGLDQLRESIEYSQRSSWQVIYEPSLEQAIEKVQALFPLYTFVTRGQAIQLLCGETNNGAMSYNEDALATICATLEQEYQRPARAIVINQQMETARRLFHEVVTVADSNKISLAQHLSRLTIHRWFGWPILLFVLWAVYKFVGEFGAGVLVDFFENRIFGELINPLATHIIDTVLPIPLVHDVLVGEYGVITMALAYGLALVLPIVTTFFLAFSILEDSGYLPRLAIMFNRTFKLMGLNGKAVLPMILGLGCDTMATLSTRILETRKERIMVTLLLALGVPCSAQLGIILGMLGQIGSFGVIVWVSVVSITMMLVGLLAAKLLPGDRSDFILELPPLRVPQISNILIKTLARLEWYLKEVLPLFIIGTLILFVLDKSGVLIIAEQLASPIVSGWLGLPTVATGAFLIGFLRRDYGAAGLFALMLAGELTTQQVIVSLIVITLFIPCVANVLMIVKEYGMKVAVAVVLTVFPLAFLVGGIVNAILNLLSATA